MQPGHVRGRGPFRILEMLITESGGPTIPIADNGGLDTDPTVGVINVNTVQLNLILVNYQFAALGTRSTSPGGGGTEFLTQNGLAQLLVGGTGSIAIIASDATSTSPLPGRGHCTPRRRPCSSTRPMVIRTRSGAGSIPTMRSVAWGTPPSPVLLYTATGQPASDPHPAGEAGTTDTPLTLVRPYGLTSRTIITLTGGSPGGLAVDRFGGTVQTFSTAIPEPASMALMLGALPVLVFGLMRRRRAAA